MWSLRVRGEDIPITTFGAPGARPLLYLHGYARHPLDYHLALEEVARRGWCVHAPFLFANHGLRRPPTSFWACAALGRRTREALVAAGAIANDTPVFGHSTGGAVALTLGAAPAPPPRILAVNPVQPSERHVPWFVLRSAWMNTKLVLGLAGDGRTGRKVIRESAVRYYVNWLRDPRRGVALVAGLRRYSYPRLERWFDGTHNTESRVRVLFGAGDEFYPQSDGLEAGLGRVFERLDVRRLADERSHSWLMIRTVRLADEVQAFFTG